VSQLPVFTSPLLAALPGVRHAFFTRKGGVSSGLYTSLNVGRGSRDDQAAVEENRRRAAAHLGFPESALSTCYQSHTATALIAARPFGEDRPKGDGVVTATPGVVCGALAADCAPVLFCDPQARVVAAAHAGWRGALDGIVGATVARMIELGAARERIVAAVGPCIGPASYEVGLDFVDRFETEAPMSNRFFLPGEHSGKRMFDLPGFVLARLAEAGVETAEWVGHDTCAEEDLLFSNRRAFKRGEDDYGRLLSAIVLV
jgi:YfiH family protein